MKRARSSILVAALLGMAASGRAQLGADEAQCLARWGEPADVREDGAGGRTLRFATNGVTVELSLLDGIARRADYQAAFGVADTMRFLALNSEGLQWSEWRVPGAQEKPGMVHWLRSDDMAMAEQEPGKLTVITAEWMRHQTAVSAATNTAASAAEEDEGEKVVEIPAPNLTGHWHSGGAEGTPMTMQMRADGGILLSTMRDGKRREFRSRWAWFDAERRAVMAMQLPQPGETPTAPPLAVLAPDVDGDVVTLTFTSAATRAYPILAEWERQADLIFVRAPAPTTAVAAAPGPIARPKQGESRAAVLARLGKPTGRMQSGEQEVLMYPWGQVWILNDVVVKVE